MKYLFFDIECSNCFHGIGKMCEFGYVIVDETFKVIKKDAIIMSPGKGKENRFDTSIYKREPGFQWAYEFDYYFSCPEFPNFYNKIKSLLTDEVKVMGFAVDNDIRYLLKTCERYKLDLFDFKAYETQKLMDRYLPEEKRKNGLQNEFKEVCGLDEYVRMQGHYSKDDAFMTMRITEEICKANNCSLEELLEKTTSAEYNCLEFYNNYKNNKNASKQKSKNDNPNHVCQVMWGNLYRECLPSSQLEESIGKRYTISKLIKEDINICTNVCNKIRERQISAVDRINESDFIICLNQEDVVRMKNTFKYPYEGEFITVEQFLDEK